MESILHLIPSKANQVPIKSDYYDAGSDCVLVFVGGDGDGKNKFDLIIEKLFSNNYPNNVLTYTYRGLDESEWTSLKQKTTDLEEVLNFAKNNLKNKTVKLFCTSMGSWATINIISSGKYNDLITDVFMLDPCDYYLSEENVDTEVACYWKGFESYAPKSPVLSDLMKQVISDVKVSVASLTLRNHSKYGYNSGNYSERGNDTDGFYPRLNTGMVKVIYEKTPSKNKGDFISVNNLPHAFMRDGDIDKNASLVCDLINQYL